MGATNTQDNHIEAAETYFRQNPSLWSQMQRLPLPLRIAILNQAANYAEEINVGTLADRIEERAAAIFETYLNKIEDPLANFPETEKKGFWAFHLGISTKTLTSRIQERGISPDESKGKMYFRKEDMRVLFEERAAKRRK